MALTIENFQTLINHKFFVSIESEQEVLDFTNLDSNGIALRQEALDANIIVFLPSINKIFARGSYYGISSSDFSTLQTQLSTLSNTVTTLGSTLSELTSLVQTQGDTIDEHDSNIDALTQLIGRNLDANDQAIITNANGIIGEIVALQRSIAALSPNGSDLTTLVEEAVEDALEEELETALGTSQTISGINTSITNINNTLTNKADKAAFDELARNVGSWQWFTAEELEENPSLTNYTISERVTELLSRVDQIPHFSIEVVDADANGLPNVNGTISPTTIYLVRSTEGADPTNNEIFTEYIYVDKNANIYADIDPETNEEYGHNWVWESLGRQYFNISNYLELSNEDWEQIKGRIETAISNLQTQLGDAQGSQIGINKTNIETLQTNLQTLETNLQNIIDSNGNFLLTGSDINTSNAQNSNTIAYDINALQTSVSTLNSNKLDKNALEWVIINEPTQEEEP